VIQNLLTSSKKPKKSVIPKPSEPVREFEVKDEDTGLRASAKTAEEIKLNIK